MLLRQAIELSAVIGDHSETLRNLTVSFIKSEFRMELPHNEISRALEREAIARLFFACGKSRPEEIRNPQNCLRLARDLWLDYSIATSNQLSADFFMKEAEERFRKEKDLNPILEMKQSPVSGMIKKLFSNPGAAQEYKTLLQKTVQYFQVAFYVLDEYFTNTTIKPLFELYNPFLSSDEKHSTIENETSAENIDDKSKSRIKYLEKSIHDLKVKLEYAQKDAIRYITMTLTSSGFGSPLFELNSIKKDKTTPEHISSAISNLFLALESLDIRISKDSLVGKIMTFDEIEEGKFCLQNDDILGTSDFVTVKYPGVKLGKEMIVKPTITKEKNYD